MKNATEGICFKAFINYITFFQDILRNFLKKTKRITKKETREKYKHICFSLKYAINKHIKSTVFYKTCSYCSTNKSSCWCGSAINTKSGARVSISFSGKNPSFFAVHVLRELYQKSFEDNVIDQTESN